MFVQYLNERQQAALLHYAHEVMLADGIVDAEEQVYIGVLRSQMASGIEAEDVPIDDLAMLFNQRPARIAFFMELTGMGYANEQFDPEQSLILRQIAQACSLTDGDVASVNSWIKRELSLFKEAERIIVSKASKEVE